MALVTRIVQDVIDNLYSSLGGCLLRFLLLDSFGLALMECTSDEIGEQASSMSCMRPTVSLFCTPTIILMSFKTPRHLIATKAWSNETGLVCLAADPSQCLASDGSHRDQSL
eukprot:4828208-Amphidinium_carterae.1